MPCYFTSHCKIDTQPSTTPKLEMKYILDNAIFNVDISRNRLVVIHNTTTFNKKPQLSTLQNNKSNKWERKNSFLKTTHEHQSITSGQMQGTEELISAFWNIWNKKTCWAVKLTNLNTPLNRQGHQSNVNNTYQL